MRSPNRGALPFEGLAPRTIISGNYRSSNARMRTQLFGVLRSYKGLNKVETNFSVISKGDSYIMQN